MNLIAAVDENWAIGNKNQLLVKIPSDLALFRRMTIGNVVVMGRKTLESFPNRQPLPDRTNLILSRNKNYHVRGGEVVCSFEELQNRLTGYDSTKVFVIGGESIYRQLLDECDTAYLTKMKYRFESDAFFPNLDQRKEWRMAKRSEEQTYFDLEYYFCRYERVRLS